MSKGFTHESAHNETVEWYTPAWLFERLGIRFDLDPCHPEGDRLPWVPVERVYTRQDNGLALPWDGRVWLNPPYGKETAHWLQKLNAHRHGIAMVFARTDNAWFHESVAHADAICFMRSRVKFVDRTGEVPIKPNGKKADSPGSGSMLVAWGADCVAALQRSRLGFVCATMRKAAPRWEASNPGAVRPALVEDTPENRKSLRRVLYQYRCYFERGTGFDPEVTPWAVDLHQRISKGGNA